MTLTEFAARVPGSEPYRSGFRAPGICHGGKKLKLNMNSAPDGTILVKCWSRGCSAASIVEAIGLSLRALCNI